MYKKFGRLNDTEVIAAMPAYGKSTLPETTYPLQDIMKPPHSAASEDGCELMAKARDYMRREGTI